MFHVKDTKKIQTSLELGVGMHEGFQHNMNWVIARPDTIESERCSSQPEISLSKRAGI